MDGEQVLDSCLCPWFDSGRRTWRRVGGYGILECGVVRGGQFSGKFTPPPCLEDGVTTPLPALPLPTAYLGRGGTSWDVFSLAVPPDAQED